MENLDKDFAELQHVLPSFGWQDFVVSSLSGGLINQTFIVKDKNLRPVAILQKLHRIFDGSVNEDIDIITKHLETQGVATPTLLKTHDNKRFVESNGGTWRALSYLQGDTFHKTPSLAHAQSAGKHVGQFHNALRGLNHAFSFKRSGVHDTENHLKNLSTKVGTSQTAWGKDADALATDILQTATHLPKLDPNLPTRICHGDLKISNLLFKPNSSEALALVDLDTMGWQTLAYELGDALRSWCNLKTENSKAPLPDFRVADAFLSGFASAMEINPSKEEIESIAIGYETICLELSARFCIDVYEDNYFGWDSEHFSTRREHNRVRAKGQLATSKFLSTKRQELQALCLKSMAS